MSAWRRPNRRILAAAALAASVYPPMLPRDPWIQLVESALLAGLGWIAGRPGRRTGPLPAVALAVALTAGLAWQGMLWIETVDDLPGGLVPLSGLVVGAGVLLLRGRPWPGGVPRVALETGALVLVVGVVVSSIPTVTSSPGTPSTPRASSAPPVHVAVAVDAADDAGARADLAVERLARQGGLARSTVVVTVPTGSGWVDEAALDALDDVTGGDVATVAVAYDDAPSWRSYLDARGVAVATTGAVLEDVRRAVGPARTVLVYGQSLGALAGARAARPGLVDGALWVGAPADTPRSAVPAVDLTHVSDPAAAWSPSLLWRPPRPATVADLPRPPWLPVVSFVQTSVDLLGALSVPAGHGHRYGAEQRGAWAALTAPAACACCPGCSA